MRALLAAGLLCVAGPAAAQVALYGAQPPKGSAFVRFVNASAAPVDIRPGFAAAQTLGASGADRVSPYAVVEKVAGKAFTVQAGPSGPASLTFVPDSYNTVLLRDGTAGQVSAAVVADGAEFNQARARLTFYNATPDCASATLALAPAGTAVFADVAPGQMRTRSVNPVQAMVRATCTGQAASDIMLDHMDVGGSYSVWLMLPAGKPVSFITKDSTLPYKP